MQQSEIRSFKQKGLMNGSNWKSDKSGASVYQCLTYDATISGGKINTKNLDF